MAMLYDVKTFWNEKDEWDFTDDRMWTGEIIKQEDGWFEGIAKDKNSEERFIYGVYGPEEFFYLWFLNSKGAEGSLYYKSVAEPDEGYYGDVTLLDTSGIEVAKIGNCHFIIQKNKKQDISNLLKKIDNWKHEMFDDERINLYESCEFDRKKIVEAAYLENTYRLTLEQREVIKKELKNDCY